MKNPLGRITDEALAVFTEANDFISLLDLLKGETESDACTINVASKINPTEYRVGCVGYESWVYKNYNDHYFQYDVTVPIALSKNAHDLFIVDEYVPRNVIDRNPVYQDLIIPSGFRWLAGGKVLDDSDSLISLALHRHSGRRQYTGDDVRVMRTLSHVLSSAARAGRVINDLRGRLAAVTNAMDRLASAIVIVDADRFVRHLNIAAKRSLDRRAPFLVLDGRLTSGSPRMAEWIVRAIRAAALEKRHEARTIGLGDEETISVNIVPAGRIEQDNWRTSTPIAIVVFEDPRDRPRNVGSRLAKAFSLTPAEADVLSLIMEGFTADEIASRRSVSVTTIRTQTRLIMMKMGVNRSSQAAIRAASVLSVNET